MTPQELQTLIASDATATALAAEGRDAECAARCTTIAPAVIVPTLVQWRGVGKAITLAGLSRLIACFDAMIALGAAAPAASEARATGRALQELLPFMQATQEGGLDMGDAQVRGMLDQWAASPAMPLTAADATTLKALAQQPQTITAAEVSAVFAAERASRQDREDQI